MNPEPEIRRLLDIMPASGRMMCKIINKPQQSTVIDSQFPLPWNRDRPIYINFDLWRLLSKPQRDLLILRNVSFLMNVKWFKPDIYQGVALAGIVGTVVELLQGDAIGTAIAGGLTGLAMTRMWRDNRSSQVELDADEAAVKLALRRGYSESEAAKYLLGAIEAVAQIESAGLDFNALIRCQNLKAIAGISTVGVPDSIRQD
ncbi:DUF3318 domain-containing protein [Tychonema sp. BBK16]|uniref:DUF3318 domain-containing protein n=1 Tax=Tychonema sp. BBK16 TaxID=2699888 RepID=UPI001F2655D0|nr:DUF3318 domain-containing protein [Tychonema sp. BBK16]MCF6373255.1 DUF3318 domain-containing protein [Tychonema sp. BBK16]